MCASGFADKAARLRGRFENAPDISSPLHTPQNCSGLDVARSENTGSMIPSFCSVVVCHLCVILDCTNSSTRRKTPGKMDSIRACSLQQVANKTTSGKGKGVVGGPKTTVAHETVTPPLAGSKPSSPSVAHETVTPPLARKEVAHETLTPPLAKGGAAAAAGGPPPGKKSGNLMIGAVLVGAVAASYYVTIHKMKGQVRVRRCISCVQVFSQSD